MPSLKAFRIEFDRPTATYMAGELVTGNIVLEITNEKNVRELRLTANGQARVWWTESRARRNDRVHNRRTYSSSEEYFDLRYNILGGHRSDTRVQIPVGVNRYPFKFPLSHNIPSSFEHRVGHVRYTVKAVIDRPWKFDHECKAAFTVISPLDLNCYQHRCLGIDDEVQKTFCCLCCVSSDSLSIRLRVPTSGYVPGQSIFTTLNISNAAADVQVTEVCTKLIRKLKFYAKLPNNVQYERTEVKSTKNAGSFPRETQVVLELPIPPIPPSNLEHCGIIDLDYILEVDVHVSGPHLKVTKNYPLMIGTIPLYGSPSAPPFDQTQAGPQSSMVPIPMPIPSNSPYPPPIVEQPGVHAPRGHPVGFVVPAEAGTSSADWQMPPPSYEDCISGGVPHIMDTNDSEYVHGASHPFAPKYPVYNFQPAPSN